ncbi:MAG: FHA domain-containing protein [Geodermatophilaceae bacterium]|nr:FHA domain-containing protein [Geodermatophilaceae bacterium]
MTRGSCEVAPGGGTVLRRHENLLWAGEKTPDAVWAGLRSLAEFTGPVAAATPLLTALAQSWLPQLSPESAFALVITDASSGVLLRFGRVAVIVAGRPVDGEAVQTLSVEEDIVLGGPEAATELGWREPVLRSDLADGAVPAGALRWFRVPGRTPRGGEPEAAVDLRKPTDGPPAPATAPPPDQDFTAPDNPVAEGFGWDQPPAADADSDLAGTAFHPPPSPFAAGPRDRGSLSFDDGHTVAVAGDIVLGRRPERHELVERGQAQPIVIHDNDNVLSSAHAAVQVQGDAVVVVDLGSLNGTHIAAPGASDWSRLDAGSPQQLHEGYRVLLGYTVLTYHNAH